MAHGFLTALSGSHYKPPALPEVTDFFNCRRPEMDALLDKAVGTLDPGKRASLYDEVQKLMTDEALVVPIYHKLMIIATSEKVKEFYPHPLKWISIEKTTVE